jgi:hypothetical protein
MAKLQKSKHATRKVRCFVSASAGTSISTVVRVLKANKVEVIDSVPPAGTELLSSTKKSLDHADFVLGIISKEKESANTLFELGIAIGLGKPIAMIVAPSFPLPTTLRIFLGFF